MDDVGTDAGTEAGVGTAEVQPRDGAAVGGAGSDALAHFTAPTRTWFTDAFAAPTTVQEEAWRQITARSNALVVAPTGSGKTLAAFLAALDRLHAGAGHEKGVHTLYISPLKALGVDVERNLQAPLRGIQRTAQRLGEQAPEVSVAIRSGDTAAADRRRIASHPPDILITTPESLFLMLTSAAREVLQAVDTVIVDEVHAIAGSKRGAHLAVSLERLESLVTAAGHPPFQRIGLSATVRPAERVAAFLGGAHPVTVVAPPAEKDWDLTVTVPVADLTELGGSGEIDPADPLAPPKRNSIWPHVENRILDEVLDHRSTIVFTNSRRIAERLTARLNELHAERLGIDLDTVHGEGHDAAEVMAQSGAAKGADPVIARAHHGSVSKEQRAAVENDLKAGLLRCVVATSSLELGIDMGAVDAVLQVASPPSVASALQRVGRAGHQVGARSVGVFHPIHRGDLLESSVVVERMRVGGIEEVPDLRNPLDVLAQQVVAAVAVAPVEADDLFALVRRSQPFAGLPRSAFDAVLDMLSGRYPSEDFAELRPRLVWDRVAGTLTARPGAQRLAATSGGTIPDRGLFGVFLVGEDDTPRAGRRVGELDEEMVYETRVGDVFTLGTSSWRVEEITHDQVRVTPAPGVPGRLPFWKGDAASRPAELGRAISAAITGLHSRPADEARSALIAQGLDDWAADNLLQYLDEQQRATGVLPAADRIVLERFRDELGDWRVCVHCPLGTAVLAPWAMVIEQRARERYGVEVQAQATNDGIVLRVPDSDAEPPGADLIVFDPAEVTERVTTEIGSSALFASRFRECAARALLLPRRDPRSRSPLWQQRMRSAQLLQVAARFPDFPIVLETVRECLHDVFDLPGLTALLGDVAARRASVVEVETVEASPFATSLLFGYLGTFMYEGDVPLGERKAAALSLDPTLLAELLGTESLAELLDDGVIAQIEADLQWLSPERRATSTENLYDLIRTAGPFSSEELTDRVDGVDVAAALTELQTARRVAPVRVGGADRWAVAEDLPRLRDALGVPTPQGWPDLAPLDPGLDPVQELIQRHARTHGPFTAEEAAARWGLGVSVVAAALRTLVSEGSVTAGSFRTPGVAEHVSSRVLALIRRRTLALLRREVEPVEQSALARFLADWQGVSPALRRANRGVDGTLAAIESLAGLALPASMVESVLLPSRVEDYQPRLLDELLGRGEVRWTGVERIGSTESGAGDGWVALWPTDLDLAPDPGEPATDEARALLAALESGGAWDFDSLRSRLAPDHPTVDATSWQQALWELVWTGRVTSDSWHPLRPALSRGVVRRPRPVAPRRGSRLQSLRRARVTSGQQLPGRWSAVTRPEPESAAARARFGTDLLLMLDRHGVLTRGSVLAERDGGGFAPVYRALSQLEERGECRRGYFVAGLGAAQFALPGAVDRLRGHADPPEQTEVVVLAACDPANPYGAALGWPERAGHRPGRKPGAIVVLGSGELLLYVERGGRSLLTFTEDPVLLGAAATALAAVVAQNWLGRVTIERADSEHVFDSAPVRTALETAGFAMTPRGMRMKR